MSDLIGVISVVVVFAISHWIAFCVGVRAGWRTEELNRRYLQGCLDRADEYGARQAAMVAALRAQLGESRARGSAMTRNVGRPVTHAILDVCEVSDPQAAGLPEDAA